MTHAQISAFVTRFPSFSALASPSAAASASRLLFRTLPAGAVYLREGDSCSGIALVLEGRLRVSKSSGGGREITLYHIEPGETCILTASCLFVGSRYPAEAVVTEHVQAVLIPADVFLHLFETDSAVRAFVLSHFTDRLATTMALVEEIAFRRVDQRAARWLADEAGAAGVVQLSHEEIAAQLGTARVVVSRLLEDFQSRGWVTLGRRRVSVQAPNALRAFSNQSD